MQTIITVPKPAAYSMKPRRVTISNSSNPVEHSSPGPAQYATQTPKILKKPSPAYSLAGKHERRAEIATPGPGAYTPKRTHFSKSPGFSFRTKHSEYEMFIGDTEFSF
jgi:hypothetical protein